MASRPARGGAAARAKLPFLFDLDGTIAHTLADIAASCNHVRALHGLRPLADAEVRPLIGDGARELVRRALDLPSGDGPVDGVVDAALAAYRAHHETQCTVHVTLFPGVRDGLAAFARSGHPLAVVTNKPERFARRIVAHLGLAELLPVVVGGDTLARQKPDPAPLRRALRDLGVAEDAGTMVGDGEQDLRAAKACGLRAIACLYGYRDAAVLRREGADAYWSAFGIAAS